MSWKRLVAWSGLICALVALGPGALAEGPADSKDNPAGGDKPGEPKAQAAPAPAPQKARWWGDRFALFLEVDAGAATNSKNVTSGIATSPTASSTGVLKLNDFRSGRIAVGWTLPAGRGALLVRFSGFRENSYSFNARGLEAQAVTPTGILTSSDPLLWWNVDVRSGQLVSTRTTPYWDASHDANHDFVPSQSEVYYLGSPDLSFSKTVPDNLQNRLQTYDFLYQRDFGGRKTSARWSAGMRYFVYKGGVPATAWLNTDFAGTGYTEGVNLRLLDLAQNTRGVGPTASLEAQWHFWRGRMTFYGQGRIAFVAQTLRMDSGPFFTLVRDTPNSTLYAAPARLTHDMSKSSWQVGGELGLRTGLVRGLDLLLAWSRTSYQDCVLVPISISIPSRPAQAVVGTVGQYNSQDLLMSEWHLGFAYQF